ncbi:MAG: hypothetical protein GXY74_14935 [Phycisphaerae bacterium]|nr:hypothetical protein [Phycisphaerae bacterium]
MRLFRHTDSMPRRRTSWPAVGAMAVVAVLAAIAGPGSRAAAASVTYPAPDTLLSFTMEEADLGKYRRVVIGQGGAVELSTEHRRSGRYSARFSIPKTAVSSRSALLWGQFTAAPRPVGDPVCLRAYVRFGPDFAVQSGQSISLLAFGTFIPPPSGSYAGHLAQAGVRNVGGSLRLYAVVGAASATGATDLVLGRWYCVEVRYSVGDPTGTLTVYLDDAPEAALTGLSLPTRPDGINVGLLSAASSAPATGGSLFIDDVIVHDAPIGTADVAVQLAHPCFVPRVGAPVVAILTGDQPGDSVEATLTSTLGLNRTVYTSDGPLNGRADFRVDLRDLPAADYTLTVRLLDASRQERAAARYSYRKLVGGDPEYAIDANNAFVHNGRRIFPVTSFGLNRSLIELWRDRHYCNMLYGKEWVTDLIGVPKYERLLDVAAEKGMDCIGPAADDRFDKNGLPQWTPEAIQEYLTELADHPGVAWWLWREEPINWGYDGASQKLWWDLVKQHNPSRMTELLEMGSSFQIGLLRGELTYMIWPYLCADIYSWDIYPIENENTSSGNFAAYAQVADQAVRWNMGLVPVMPNVAVADVTVGRGGGTPTPAEIDFVCWLSIVHRAKGIHWYPYQGTVPPENYAAMTRFVDQTTALTEAILGEESPVAVTHEVPTGGRVDIRATTDGANLYVFAVNLERTPQTVRFTVDGLPEGAAITVYDQQRQRTAGPGGTFEDAFSPIGVNIYVFETPAPGDVTGWTIPSVHGATTHSVSCPEEFVYSPAAGVRQIEVFLSKAADPATVAPSGFSLVGQSGGDLSARIVAAVLSADHRALTVTFDGPLPDADRYTMTVLDTIRDSRGQPFGGDVARRFACLAGDVDGSGAVTSADILAARGAAGAALNATTLRLDVDGSGSLTPADMRVIRGLLGHTLP